MIRLKFRGINPSNIFLTGFLLMLCFELQAQTTDTLFVYEYEYITDTVWVEDIPAQRDTTKYIPLASKNPTFFSGDSATFLKAVLQSNEPQNQYQMKKTTFISLLLLSLQNISFAQPELNLIAGFTNYWMNPNPYVSSAIFLSDQYGIELKIPFENAKMAISAGYEQHGYFFGAYSEYILHHSENIKEADYHIQIYRALPFLFYYKHAGLDLFAGYEYKMIPSQDEYNWNEHAFITGFDYDIGRKFAVSTKLYFGGLVDRHQPATNRIISRRSISFSLKYNLFWRAKYNSIKK